MLRAPFKSRPSREDSPAIPSKHPTPDLIADGDTPSLPQTHGSQVTVPASPGSRASRAAG